MFPLGPFLVSIFGPLPNHLSFILALKSLPCQFKVHCRKKITARRLAVYAVYTLGELYKNGARLLRN